MIIKISERENDMKYFKTKCSRTAQRYRITSDNFKRMTKNQYPYEQPNTQKQIAQYAICPSCLNPIQLIGMNRGSQVQPYGRHTGKRVKGLADWKQVKYEYCPYAAKNDRREPDEDEHLAEIDEHMIELYELMKSQFDRVVYVASKELGVWCSEAFRRKVLIQFMANEVYAYPWLTDANLPYIFAYMGMRHQNTYKQKFLVDSDLYRALEKHPDVHFVETTSPKYRMLLNKEGAFPKLWFRFTNHTHKVQEGETLKETMQFCVDDIARRSTVYERTVEFSETYFQNLLNKAGNEGKRQKQYLDMAEELMTPLHIE